MFVSHKLHCNHCIAVCIPHILTVVIFASYFLCLKVRLYQRIITIPQLTFQSFTLTKYINYIFWYQPYSRYWKDKVFVCLFFFTLGHRYCISILIMHSANLLNKIPFNIFSVVLFRSPCWWLASPGMFFKNIHTKKSSGDKELEMIAHCICFFYFWNSGRYITVM